MGDKVGSSNSRMVVKQFNAPRKLALWGSTMNLVTTRCTILAEPTCDVFIHQPLYVDNSIFAAAEQSNQLSPTSITSANIDKLKQIVTKQYTTPASTNTQFGIDYTSLKSHLPGLADDSTNGVDIMGIIALIVAAISSHHP
jgi:hypothetical protein